jgi:hypothetical protein
VALVILGSHFIEISRWNPDVFGVLMIIKKGFPNDDQMRRGGIGAGVSGDDRTTYVGRWQGRSGRGDARLRLLARRRGWPRAH